jgi:hypothetical protein
MNNIFPRHMMNNISPRRIVILKSVVKVDRDKPISLWPLLFIAGDLH